MAVYNIRIESDAEWCSLELCSAAMWARAPGRSLQYVASGAAIDGANLTIDDRNIHLSQDASARGELKVQLQVATNDNSVSLRTNKGAAGELRVTSAAHARRNDMHATITNEVTMQLYLIPELTQAAGGDTGDPALR